MIERHEPIIIIINILHNKVIIILLIFIIVMMSCGNVEKSDEKKESKTRNLYTEKVSISQN